MKILVMLPFFIALTVVVNAQSHTNHPKNTQTTKKVSETQRNSNSQNHGAKDTTPGSPMGTGGAGGDLSGSPAASAIETDDQTNKAHVGEDTTTSTTAKPLNKTIKRTRTAVQPSTKGKL